LKNHNCSRKQHIEHHSGIENYNAQGWYISIKTKREDGLQKKKKKKKGLIIPGSYVITPW
jgi:hypothetical protein